MDFLKNINIFRRNLTIKITQNIGNSKTAKNKYKSIDRNAVKRVLISRPNHRLGNMLLITPMVQEVKNIFPNCTIDLFVKGTIANVVFENYEYVDEVISLPKKHFKHLGQYLSSWFLLKRKKYDLAVNCIEYSSSGRISTQLANAENKFFGAELHESTINSSKEDLHHIAKNTIYGLRNYLSKCNVQFDAFEIPNLDIKLSPEEVSQGKNSIDNLVEKNKKTIAIFTYATGSKCYSTEWWCTFYESLKNTFPNHNIIEILPVENISMINFQAPSFYSKDIREIASVIANTECFIGADSGMMHLASASLTKTIGLFAFTNIATYKPYGNGSFAIDTNLNSIEDCVATVAKSLTV